MRTLFTAAAIAAALLATSAWAAEPDEHAVHHPAAAGSAGPATPPPSASSTGGVGAGQPMQGMNMHAGMMGPGGMHGMHGMGGMEEKLMHEMCTSVMGKEMKNRPVHEHSREKGGMAMWPNGKPLSAEEMAAMHRECAAKMASDLAGKQSR